MTEHVFCNWTISGKAAEAEALARTIASSGVQITTVAGFESIKPRPARSGRIDPETVLKRKVITVKPLHSSDYFDRRAASKRNRDVAAQAWA
jgi:hypothetical protein